MESKSAAEFLEQKFKEWRLGVSRKEGTVVGFAKHLKVKRDILNKWMNGTLNIGPKYAQLLASKLGVEIYKYIDVPAPDVQVIIDRLRAMSADRRRQVAALLEDDEDRLKLLEIYERLPANRRKALVDYANLFLQVAGKEEEMDGLKYPILALIRKYWEFIPDELKAELPISDWSLFLENEISQVNGDEAEPANNSGG